MPSAGVVKGLMLVAEARLKFANGLAIQQNQSTPTGVGGRREKKDYKTMYSLIN